MYSDSPNKNQSTRRLDMPTDRRHPSPSNFVFALAYELKQYLETNADILDPNTYDREGCFWLRSISNSVIADGEETSPCLTLNRGVDNINYWRGGILSKKAISDEDLSEIIEYIPAEKLQELIELASSKT